MPQPWKFFLDILKTKMHTIFKKVCMFIFETKQTKTMQLRNRTRILYSISSKSILDWYLLPSPMYLSGADYATLPLKASNVKKLKVQNERSKS